MDPQTPSRRLDDSMPTKSTPKPKAKSVSSASKPSKAAPKSKSPTKARKTATPSSSGDWRVQTLDQMRKLIFEADPEMVEEQKWIKPTRPLGVPLWSHDGMVCTGEMYKQVVKLTFAYGASLPDPAGLFNTGFGGGTRRAIDIPEGAKVDARAFKALVKAAVALNASKKKR